MANEEIRKLMGPMFEGLSADGRKALAELALPPHAAVLDVGTGSGKFATFLAMEGFDVLTGEPSSDETHYAGKDWQETARTAGVRDKIRFQAFDASDMPFESQSFDAVFFYGVLHHVVEASRSAVMREALRVIKQDGAVVFFEPNKELLDRLAVDDPGHPLAANPSSYVSLDGIAEKQLDGQLMNIFIYSHAV